MRCRDCGSETETIVPGPHPGGHHAKAECSGCRRFKRWIAKPGADRVKRPASHRDLATKFGKGMCVLCGKKKDELPPNQTLEAHHIVEFAKGGTNDADNILVVCTGCHNWIHWRRHWT